MLPTRASSPFRSIETIRSRPIKDSDSFRSRAQELEILNILNWPEVMFSVTRAHWTPTLTNVARTYNKWAQLIEGLFGGPHVKASVERVAVFVDASYISAQCSFELSGQWLSRIVFDLD